MTLPAAQSGTLALDPGSPDLRFERVLAGAGSVADAAPDLLARRDYRFVETDDRAAPPLLGVGSTAMGSETVSCSDLWRAPSAVRAARVGCVDYRIAGAWLQGTARVDAGGSLADATERAYRDLFEVLDREHGMRLARVWNYLAGINAPDRAGAARGTGDEALAAVERYRLFNLGRQRAFLAARRDAFEGAPAACALGTERGAPMIHFLATRHPVRPVENPRQVSAYRYPAEYGPRSPTFSRAVVVAAGVSEHLFISGTASIVGHETRHPGDVRRQADETLANIDAIVAAASAAGRAGYRADQLDYTIYVRDRRDLDSVRERFVARFGAGQPASQRAIYVRADICRADLLVEIEAHGDAPAEVAP